MTGVKSSEITYLGCHSDLWSFKKKKFSTFVLKNKLEKKIPKIYKSWKNLGKVKKEVLIKTNLYNNCNVYCGGHDSSFSYYLYEKKFKKSFTLISTGTWIVIFTPFFIDNIIISLLCHEMVCFPIGLSMISMMMIFLKFH